MLIIELKAIREDKASKTILVISEIGLKKGKVKRDIKEKMFDISKEWEVDSLELKKS